MRLYRTGDSGGPVPDIQRRLAAVGHSSRPDPPGEFGQGTESAVLAFQEERGLARDGIVGPDTWRALYEAGYALGDRLLFYRSPMLRGDDVADLQRRLNEFGFDADKVDGVFGPLTHRAVLDFEANRSMAEDGVVGPRVIEELKALQRTPPQAGRERVREREWLRGLPRTVVGTRIYLDPAGSEDALGAALWDLTTEIFVGFQNLGGVPVLSHSVDVSPPATVRARRANRLGADLTLSFRAPGPEGTGIYFFQSPHSRSEAGFLLASVLADALGVSISGRTTPMLKNTRAPAVLIAIEPTPKIADAVLAGVCDFFRRAAEEMKTPDPKNAAVAATLEP